MTALAAKVVHMCLTARLEAPFGANLAPGQSADVLAREFRGGLAALLQSLADEAAGRCAGFAIHGLLMEVWTRPGDDRHLKTATGKTRQEWLDMPLWEAASTAPVYARTTVEA